MRKMVIVYEILIILQLALGLARQIADYLEASHRHVEELQRPVTSVWDNNPLALARTLFLCCTSNVSQRRGQSPQDCRAHLLNQVQEALERAAREGMLKWRDDQFSFLSDDANVHD